MRTQVDVANALVPDIVVSPPGETFPAQRSMRLGNDGDPEPRTRATGSSAAAAVKTGRRPSRGFLPQDEKCSGSTWNAGRPLPRIDDPASTLRIDAFDVVRRLAEDWKASSSQAWDVRVASADRSLDDIAARIRDTRFEDSDSRERFARIIERTRKQLTSMSGWIHVVDRQPEGSESAVAARRDIATLLGKIQSVMLDALERSSMPFMDEVDSRFNAIHTHFEKRFCAASLEASLNKLLSDRSSASEPPPSNAVARPLPAPLLHKRVAQLKGLPDGGRPSPAMIARIRGRALAPLEEFPAATAIPDVLKSPMPLEDFPAATAILDVLKSRMARLNACLDRWSEGETEVLDSVKRMAMEALGKRSASGHAADPSAAAKEFGLELDKIFDALEGEALPALKGLSAIASDVAQMVQRWSLESPGLGRAGPGPSRTGGTSPAAALPLRGAILQAVDRHLQTISPLLAQWREVETRLLGKRSQLSTTTGDLQSTIKYHAMQAARAGWTPPHHPTTLEKLLPPPDFLQGGKAASRHLRNAFSREEERIVAQFNERWYGRYADDDALALSTGIDKMLESVQTRSQGDRSGRSDSVAAREDAVADRNLSLRSVALLSALKVQLDSFEPRWRRAADYLASGPPSTRPALTVEKLIQDSAIASRLETLRIKPSAGAASLQEAAALLAQEKWFSEKLEQDAKECDGRMAAEILARHVADSLIRVWFPGHRDDGAAQGAISPHPELSLWKDDYPEIARLGQEMIALGAEIGAATGPLVAGHEEKLNFRGEQIEKRMDRLATLRADLQKAVLDVATQHAHSESGISLQGRLEQGLVAAIDRHRINCMQASVLEQLEASMEAWSNAWRSPKPGESVDPLDDYPFSLFTPESDVFPLGVAPERSRRAAPPPLLLGESGPDMAMDLGRSPLPPAADRSRNDPESLSPGSARSSGPQESASVHASFPDKGSSPHGDPFRLFASPVSEAFPADDTSERSGLLRSPLSVWSPSGLQPNAEPDALRNIPGAREIRAIADCVERAMKPLMEVASQMKANRHRQGVEAILEEAAALSEVAVEKMKASISHAMSAVVGLPVPVRSVLAEQVAKLDSAMGEAITVFSDACLDVMLRKVPGAKSTEYFQSMCSVQERAHLAWAQGEYMEVARHLDAVLDRVSEACDAMAAGDEARMATLPKVPARDFSEPRSKRLLDIVQQRAERLLSLAWMPADWTRNADVRAMLNAGSTHLKQLTVDVRNHARGSVLSASAALDPAHAEAALAAGLDKTFARYEKELSDTFRQFTPKAGSSGTVVGDRAPIEHVHAAMTGQPAPAGCVTAIENVDMANALTRNAELARQMERPVQFFAALLRPVAADASRDRQPRPDTGLAGDYDTSSNPFEPMKRVLADTLEALTPEAIEGLTHEDVEANPRLRSLLVKAKRLAEASVGEVRAEMEYAAKASLKLQKDAVVGDSPAMRTRIYENLTQVMYRRLNNVNTAQPADQTAGGGAQLLPLSLDTAAEVQAKRGSTMILPQMWVTSRSSRKASSPSAPLLERHRAEMKRHVLDALINEFKAGKQLDATDPLARTAKSLCPDLTEADVEAARLDALLGAAKALFPPPDGKRGAREVLQVAGDALSRVVPRAKRKERQSRPDAVQPLRSAATTGATERHLTRGVEPPTLADDEAVSRSPAHASIRSRGNQPASGVGLENRARPSTALPDDGIGVRPSIPQSELSLAALDELMARSIDEQLAERFGPSSPSDAAPRAALTKAEVEEEIKAAIGMDVSELGQYLKNDLSEIATNTLIPKLLEQFRNAVLGYDRLLEGNFDAALGATQRPPMHRMLSDRQREYLKTFANGDAEERLRAFTKTFDEAFNSLTSPFRKFTPAMALDPHARFFLERARQLTQETVEKICMRIEFAPTLPMVPPPLDEAAIAVLPEKIQGERRGEAAALKIAQMEPFDNMKSSLNSDILQPHRERLAKLAAEFLVVAFRPPSGINGDHPLVDAIDALVPGGLQTLQSTFSSQGKSTAPVEMSIEDLENARASNANPDASQSLDAAWRQRRPTLTTEIEELKKNPTRVDIETPTTAPIEVDSRTRALVAKTELVRTVTARYLAEIDEGRRVPAIEEEFGKKIDQVCDNEYHMKLAESKANASQFKTLHAAVRSAREDAFKRLARDRLKYTTPAAAKEPKRLETVNHVTPWWAAPTVRALVKQRRPWSALKQYDQTVKKLSKDFVKDLKKSGKEAAEAELYVAKLRVRRSASE
jgi:hypothetical protein